MVFDAIRQRRFSPGQSTVTEQAANRGLRGSQHLLCVVPYPSNTGFAWNYIEGIYAGVSIILAEKGFRTWVAYPKIEAAPRPLEGSPAVPIEFDASLSSLRSVLVTIVHVRALRIDCIYFTDTGLWHWAFPLLRLAGVRWIVAHDHTSGHRDLPTGIKRILKWVKARIPGASADRILTVSEYVSRRQREVALVPTSKVFTILNGLPKTASDGELIEPIKELDPNRMVITCVCRAAPEKGVDVLFRAFELLVSEWPDANALPQLVYVGEGPQLEHLRKLRAQLRARANILLLGYRSDVPAILKHATIAVVPSIWEDACPLGVLEPMAQGKAVIASAVGGVPEQINDSQVGVLVPRGDERALADAMRDLLLQDERRESIGRAARARVENELSYERQLTEIAEHLSWNLRGAESGRSR